MAAREHVIERDGYGFPGHLEPRRTVTGWWSTPDVGHLDEAGYLTVAGRADDCIRTAAGHLVNPAEIAAAVEGYRGIVDAAVVPLGDALDPVAGQDHRGANRGAGPHARARQR
jgi:acyl-CoA synthetase (AMP-forming)/AMP-acid ligase II